MPRRWACAGHPLPLSERPGRPRLLDGPRPVDADTSGRWRSRRSSDIVATQFRTIPGPDGIDRHIQNRDVMLWLYEGATGVKTGYTSQAGYCVVATAERDGRRLVAVVLGSPGDAFSDAAALLDHGFAAFTEHTFVTAGEPHGVGDAPGRQRARRGRRGPRGARPDRRRSSRPRARRRSIRRRRTRRRRGSGSHG